MLKIDEREAKEILLAIFYAENCNHGTAGHNRLNLIAKLASHMGFEQDGNDPFLRFPEGVEADIDRPLHETPVKDGGRKHG